MNICRKIMVITIIGLFIGAGVIPNISGNRSMNNGDGDDETSPNLPRWREGGTPHEPSASLIPYMLQSSISKDDPDSGLIESQPEYEPTHGVVFWYNSGTWDSVVCDLVVGLTQNESYDEIAFVVTTSTVQMNLAISDFTAAGANMSKVQFIIEPGNSIWIRDYGPHFIWQGDTIGIVDSHYYASRPLDNFNPTLLGDNHFIVPTYDMGLYYSGGNFYPGPNRSAYVTDIIMNDNPEDEGFNEPFIAELFQTYQGIDTLHVFPALPGSVDATGHIDMWMFLVNESTVIISEFKPGSNPTAIQITDNAVTYMESLGFTVYRPQAWNSGGIHYTYTNSLRVNNRIFIPSYGQGNPNYLDEDADALAQWQAAAGPDVEVIQIDCYSIIPAAGAIHCIVQQMPRYTDPEPAVHVISPKGGELYVPGTTETIQWNAADTNNANIPQIDLYYSLDGGNNYHFIATTSDTGYYNWTVPYACTDQALVKVVAISADTDQTEAISSTVFDIFPADQTKYNFTTGAGVDKFGWGYQTISWLNVNQTRKPVTTEIDSLVTGAYTKISSSDADGGDTDPNRYISPFPSYNSESTHVYEFTINEDPAEIDDIEIIWEGYADYCSQAELYIWDYIEQQWSNGEGLFSQNRYMDCWAGNHDGYLEDHIRDNFSRYINTSGQITLLLYAERGDETFHDFLQITISDITVVSKNITSLTDKWNFISLPFNQSINKTDIIVNYNGGDYSWSEAVANGYVSDYIFDWNRVGQYYIFGDVLKPGYGYWVYSYVPCDFWTENISLTSDYYITTVEEKWNIIGIPFDQTLFKTDITIDYADVDYNWSEAVTNGYISDYIFYWFSNGQYYIIYDHFVPGEAYWMYSYQLCKLKRNS